MLIILLHLLLCQQNPYKTQILHNVCVVGTALCSSLGSLEQIVNCKKPLEISVTVTSKPQYYRTRDKVKMLDSDLYVDIIIDL